MGTLAAGATGAYDGEFATLARTLVRYDEGDAVLRLGWEFNGTWYPWSVTDAAGAADYAAFFRAVVNTMRAVPGTAFRFVRNLTSAPEPNRPRTPIPGTPTSTTSASISTTRCGASRWCPAWRGPVM